MTIEYEQEFELYHYGDSLASQMARLALEEKQIPYKSHMVILESKGEHLRDEYKKINPASLVPTLVHNGNPVYDSRKIMKYLDDYAAEQGTPLYPRDPAVQKQLEDLIFEFSLDEDIDFDENFGTATAACSVYILAKLLRRRPLFTVIVDYILHHPNKRRVFAFIMLRIFNQLPPGMNDKALNVVAKGLIQIEQSLDHKKDYLMGDYCVVDLMLTTLFHRFEDVHLGSILDSDQLPNIRSWWGRIKQRPGYQKAMLDFHNPDFRSAIDEVYGDKPSPYLEQLWEEVAKLGYAPGKEPEKSSAA